MTNGPTAEQEALEKAWRLLNLQADTMLKRSQARVEVWKVVLGAFIAGGVLVAVTAVLTCILLLNMVGTPDGQANCSSGTAYQPSRINIRLSRIERWLGIEVQP